MADVTIVGAGVAGLWAARELLALGLVPRLLDRHGAPGAHGCSWWAGGMLAPDCEGAVAEPVVVSAGRAAAGAWAGVTEISRNGTLVLAPERDLIELDAFAARTSGHALLDAGGIAGLEPELEGLHRRGLFFASEAHLEPRRALADLVAALAAKGIGIEQAEVEPEEIAGPVLDCRGLAAEGSLGRVCGGLRGVRGEILVLHSAGITLHRPVRLLHPRHPLYVVPRGDGLFMLGATQIESAGRAGITVRAALELLSSAIALDPRFAEAEIVETGAGLRPAFADNVPRIVRRGRVLHLNGLFRHGYLLAPELGRQAAEYLARGRKGGLFHEA